MVRVISFESTIVMRVTFLGETVRPLGSHVAEATSNEDEKKSRSPSSPSLPLPRARVSLSIRSLKRSTSNPLLGKSALFFEYDQVDNNALYIYTDRPNKVRVSRRDVQ